MPSSTTRPWSITTTRSARAAVVSRWATTSVVRRAREAVGGLVDLRLGGQVQRGRRLVEQQDVRVDEFGAGQRDQLALARRRGCGRARRPRAGSRRRAWRSCRGRRPPGPPPPPRRRWRPGGRRRWRRGRCRGRGTPPAGRRRAGAGSAVRSSVAQVRAVDRDRAGGGVVEPGDQLDQGRLARAGLADEGDCLTRRNASVRCRSAPLPRACLARRWRSGSARPRRRSRRAATHARRGLVGAAVEVGSSRSSSWMRPSETVACW